MNSELVNSLLKDDRFSLQIRTDILDVHFGLRQGSRIICQLNGEIEDVLKYIIAFDLSISVGKGFVGIKSSNQIFEDYFGIVDSQKDRGIPLYIAKNQDSADKLRISDENNNDSEFGKLLSYPSCCINTVHINKKVPSLIDALDYLVLDGKYNIWCWPVASIADASLLSHFPCSFNCEYSSHLAQKRYKYIKKYSSKFLFNRILKMHSSFYYTDKKNVMYSSSYTPNSICPNTQINEF